MQRIQDLGVWDVLPAVFPNRIVELLLIQLKFVQLSLPIIFLEEFPDLIQLKFRKKRHKRLQLIGA